MNNKRTREDGAGEQQSSKKVKDIPFSSLVLTKNEPGEYQPQDHNAGPRGRAPSKYERQNPGQYQVKQNKQDPNNQAKQNNQEQNSQPQNNQEQNNQGKQKKQNPNNHAKQNNQPQNNQDQNNQKQYQVKQNKQDPKAKQNNQPQNNQEQNNQKQYQVKQNKQDPNNQAKQNNQALNNQGQNNQKQYQVKQNKQDPNNQPRDNMQVDNTVAQNIQYQNNQDKQNQQENNPGKRNRRKNKKNQINQNTQIPQENDQIMQDSDFTQNKQKNSQMQTNQIPQENTQIIHSNQNQDTQNNQGKQNNQNNQNNQNKKKNKKQKPKQVPQNQIKERNPAQGEEELVGEEIGEESQENVHLTNQEFPKNLFCYKNIIKHWQYMSQVQAQTLPHALAGKDAEVQAKTGSGKTLAFLIPAIEMLSQTENYTSNSVLVIILAPVRELCLQISKVAHQLLGENPHKIGVRVVIGGIKEKSVREVQQNSKHIVIGTPGMLRGFIEDGTVSVSNVKYLVMDEADRLLDLGFREDARKISAYCPKGHQRLMFSATMTPDVREAGGLKPNHVVINTIAEGEAHSNEKTIIEYTQVEAVDLLGTLLAVLKDLEKKQEHSVIVFTETADTAKFLQLWAAANGVKKTLLLSGKINQNKRTAAYESFGKDGGVVFASDLVSRGMDFPQVSVVIQVGVASTVDVYTHRIGRTGRMGKAGRALSILLPFHMGMLSQLNAKKGIIPTKINIEPIGSFKSPADTIPLEDRCKGYKSFLCSPSSYPMFASDPQQLREVGEFIYVVPTTNILMPNVAKKISRMGANGAQNFCVKSHEYDMLKQYLDKIEQGKQQHQQQQEVKKAGRKK